MSQFKIVITGNVEPGVELEEVQGLTKQIVRALRERGCTVTHGSGGGLLVHDLEECKVEEPTGNYPPAVADR